LTWEPRLDKLYVTASLHGGHTNSQLNGFHQLADEQGPACPIAVECLRHQEQWASCAEGFNPSEHSLEEEKGIFERYILIKKRRAGAQQDDQAHRL
jgi:hypothetical protein